MNEPVIVKNTFAVAIVALLQAVAPAVVAVSMLYLTIFAYDVKFEDYFHAMAVIVALLMLLLPYPARTVNTQIFSGAVPLAAGVVMRWAIMLAALLAIAYIAKFTEQYSRRVVLTWAVLTPAVLIVVTTLLHEIMRRLMCTPAMRASPCSRASTTSARPSRSSFATASTACPSQAFSTIAAPTD